jgi:hypothetical protein
MWNQYDEKKITTKKQNLFLDDDVTHLILHTHKWDGKSLWDNELFSHIHDFFFDFFVSRITHYFFFQWLEDSEATFFVHFVVVAVAVQQASILIIFLQPKH